MLQKNLFFFTTFFLSWCSVVGQNKTSKELFQSPIPGMLGITGSFGEIRPDHFHSGVDLRTENRIGMEVKAVYDGYISRIYISPTGFGKAIYVDHPNGLTSVYAHMDRFYPAANKYMKAYQYQNKTYSADVFPKANELPVKKGDLLGYSGNSGGSFGPHLHYELRTTYDQKPINPIPDYLEVIDTIAPTIKSLHTFRLDSSSYANGYERKVDFSISKNGKNYTISKTINASGSIGIGIDAMDRLNSYSTQCGFKTIALKVNNKLIYNITLDKFSYTETRYTNSIIDYATRYSTGKEIIKLFVDPNNHYSGLRNVVNNGHVQILPDSLYKFDIQVIDAIGNESNLSFTIKGVNPPPKPESGYLNPQNVVNIPWGIDKSIFNDTFTLFIPKNTLYDNLNFTYSFAISPLYPYSPLVHLHNPLTPLHQKVQLSIKTTNLPEKYHKKALLATFDAAHKPVPAGGEWKNGYVKGLIRTFGDYFITIDTVAPLITPINIRQGAVMTKSHNIQIAVKDDFSGIKSINGYIDQDWVLFEYDQKNNLITYNFDKERIKNNSKHTLKLFVKDDRENESSFVCDFFW